MLGDVQRKHIQQGKMTALTERSERAIVMWSIVDVSNDESESARYKVHVQLCAIKCCVKKVVLV